MWFLSDLVVGRVRKDRYTALESEMSSRKRVNWWRFLFYVSSSPWWRVRVGLSVLYTMRGGRVDAFAGSPTLCCVFVEVNS